MIHVTKTLKLNKTVKTSVTLLTVCKRFRPEIFQTILIMIITKEKQNNGWMDAIISVMCVVEVAFYDVLTKVYNFVQMTLFMWSN